MKINQYILAGAAVAAYLFIGGGMYVYGHKHGVQEGLDKYHEACYTGGVMVDEATGTVVQCAPLGRVPREELPNFFPKGVDNASKVVYN